MKLMTIHKPAEPTDDDFCWAREGEVAIPTILVCASNCGCERSHSGVDSKTASTQLKVTLVETGPEALVDAYIRFLKNAGWGELAEDENELRNWAQSFADDIADAASEFPEGAVVRPIYHRATDTWTYQEVK